MKPLALLTPMEYWAGFSGYENSWEAILFSTALGFITTMVLYYIHLQGKPRAQRREASSTFLMTLISDFSFDFYILRKLCSFFYGISLIFFFSCVWYFLISLPAGRFEILVPCGALGCLILTRILSELFIVLVKIAENTSRMRRELDLIGEDVIALLPAESSHQ